MWAVMPRSKMMTMMILRLLWMKREEDAISVPVGRVLLSEVLGALQEVDMERKVMTRLMSLDWRAAWAVVEEEEDMHGLIRVREEGREVLVRSRVRLVAVRGESEVDRGAQGEDMDVRKMMRMILVGELLYEAVFCWMMRLSK